jgi:hypothetical protein
VTGTDRRDKRERATLTRIGFPYRIIPKLSDTGVTRQPVGLFFAQALLFTEEISESKE